MSFRYAVILLFVSSFLQAACTHDGAVRVLAPGAAFVMSNDDPSTLVWQSSLTQPTTTQIASQITTCQANQVQLAVYSVEASTTLASLQGQTTGYVAANAVSQVKINQKVARINELQALITTLLATIQ